MSAVVAKICTKPNLPLLACQQLGSSGSVFFSKECGIKELNLKASHLRNPFPSSRLAHLSPIFSEMLSLDKFVLPQGSLVD